MVAVGDAALFVEVRDVGEFGSHPPVLSDGEVPAGVSELALAGAVATSEAAAARAARPRTAPALLVLAERLPVAVGDACFIGHVSCQGGSVGGLIDLGDERSSGRAS